MGELDNLESVKTRLKDDAQALVEQQSFLKVFEDAIKLFELQPGFPGAQVWMRDRMSKLWQAASAECREFGSKARAKFALTQYDIRAASSGSGGSYGGPGISQMIRGGCFWACNS